MKKVVLAIVIFFLATTDVLAGDRLIVKYKEGTPEAEKATISEETEGRRRLRGERTEVLVVERGKRERTLERIRRSRRVEFVEEDGVAEAMAVKWYLEKIQAPQAWELVSAKDGVEVAVLDSGIETTHEGLAGKVILNQSFTDDGSEDGCGHGTMVAGVVEATTNNSLGLVNGKVLNNSCSGYYSWIVNGIYWAVEAGAEVINLSLGGTFNSRALQEAVQYAWDHGVVIVAAAGNNGSTRKIYPAAYEPVIAVAATDEWDRKARFSSYGKWVEIAAPGVKILTTAKGNTYRLASGTSLASPQVAGAAGLVWSNLETPTNLLVRQKLEQSADKINKTGRYWLWGRLNLWRAVN